MIYEMHLKHQWNSQTFLFLHIIDCEVFPPKHHCFPFILRPDLSILKIHRLVQIFKGNFTGLKTIDCSLILSQQCLSWDL